MGRWSRRYAAHVIPVGTVLHTMARVKILPVLRRWCRRYAARFTAVGVVFRTTARVNTACFSAVGVVAMLVIELVLVPPFALWLW